MKKWRAEFSENGSEYTGYIEFYANDAYLKEREDRMYSEDRMKPNELVIDGMKV